MTPPNPTGPGPPMVKVRPWICCWWILWGSRRSRVTGEQKQIPFLIPLCTKWLVAYAYVGWLNMTKS